VDCDFSICSFFLDTRSHEVWAVHDRSLISDVVVVVVVVIVVAGCYIVVFVCYCRCQLLSLSVVIVAVDCCRCRLLLSNLEAFSVDNGWARFVVFLLGDPHLLEGGERSQDGSSDPDGVFPLWWCDDLDLHGGWGKG